jgi:hypothetical protein
MPIARVSNPELLGLALIWLTLIRIRILIGRIQQKL